MTYYTVAIPNMPPTDKGKYGKVWDEMVKLLKSLEGFYGVHPCWPNGTILFFDSLNNAKRARNILKVKLNAVGKNICEAEWDRETGTMTIKGEAV